MITFDTKLIEIGLEKNTLYTLLRFFSYHGKENPTVKDLCDFTKKNIQEIDCVGPKKAKEIIGKIHELGFLFKDEQVGLIKEIPENLKHLKKRDIEVMRDILINEENTWESRIKNLELALQQARKNKEDIERKILYVETYLPSEKWRTK